MSATIGLFDIEAKSAQTVSDLFNQISAGVAVVSGQTIATDGNHDLTISRRHATTAIIIICIVLFPLGLLALLVRPTETITVRAKQEDGKVIASVDGNGDDHVVSFLRDLLG